MRTLEGELRFRIADVDLADEQYNSVIGDDFDAVSVQVPLQLKCYQLGIETKQSRGLNAHYQR